MTRFAKRQLIRCIIVIALKYGFKTLLTNPRGTTNSKEHNELMRRYGLDRHTASAYLTALRGLEATINKNTTNNHEKQNSPTGCGYCRYQ